MKNSEGNVLFLILIAVALFAALSYAVTNSNRTGAGNAASESAEMGAARMMGFMAKLDAAALRITMNKGTQVHQIIYSTPTYKWTDGSTKFTSPTQSSNPGNALFLTETSGLVAEQFYDLRDTSLVVTVNNSTTELGHLFFSWQSIPNLGTTNAEAIANVIGIREDICLKINQKAGIDVIPVMSGGLTVQNLVNSSGNPGAHPLPLSAANLALIAGKYDICIKFASPDARYMYLHAFRVF